MTHLASSSPIRGIRKLRLSMLTAFAAAVGIASVSGFATAQEGAPREARTTTHSGEVQSVSGNTLTMTVNGANEHTHRVREDARVTLNGRRVELSQLRPGDAIEVTTPRSDRNMAIAISATRERENGIARNRSRQPTSQDDFAEPRRPEADDDTRRRFDDEPQRFRDEGDDRPTDRQDRAARQDRPRGRDQIDRQADPRTADTPGRFRETGGELGVALQAADQGVRIRDVEPRSAADRAGLQRGDYLLSVDGRRVDEPRQVSQWIGNRRAGEEVTLVVWRNGQRFRARATLAAAESNDGFGTGDIGDSRQGADSRRRGDARDNTAWLGVALSQSDTTDDGDQRGPQVEHVYPTSPAAFAGLQSGDRIVAADDRQFDSTEALTEFIRQKSPGDEVTLSVATEEGDEPQEVRVTLASRNEYISDGSQRDTENNPLYAIPEYAMRMEQDRRMAECQKRMEELMLETLREVRELRAEVAELKAASRESE